MNNSFKKSGSPTLIYYLISSLVQTLVILLITWFLAWQICLMLEIPQIFTTAFLWILFITLLCFILIFGINFLQYINCKYLLDKTSILFQKGTLSVLTTSIPYTKITNASFYQTFFHRIFRVGKILIDQEDSKYCWGIVDTDIADGIIKTISKESNVQRLAR